MHYNFKQCTFPQHDAAAPILHYIYYVYELVIINVIRFQISFEHKIFYHISAIMSHY